MNISARQSLVVRYALASYHLSTLNVQSSVSFVHLHHILRERSPRTQPVLDRHERRHAHHQSPPSRAAIDTRTRIFHSRLRI
jgi:hypothetical protein